MTSCTTADGCGAGSVTGEKYYPATLNLLYMLLMTGNMPNLYDINGFNAFTPDASLAPSVSEIDGVQQVKGDTSVGLSGFWNWAAYHDKYNIGTKMSPDSGASPLFLRDGIKYVRINAKVQEPIRVALLNEASVEAGGESGMYLEAGTDYKDYMIDLTAEGGVGSISVKSIEFLDAGKQVNAAKIPVSGMTVRIDGTKAGTLYAVFGLRGKMIAHGNVLCSTAVIPVADKGMYFVRIGNRISKVAVK